MYVCQSRPLTVELGGLLRAFDCFFIGYVGMVTTTFGAQQLAALVALLNYDHIPLRYRFICDFCGRGILLETFDFLDCANYSVFLVKVFLRYKLRPPLEGARDL